MVKLPNKFIEMKKRTISCRLLNPDLRVDRLRVVAKLSEGEFTAKFVNEFEDGVFMVEIYSEGKLLNDTMRMEMDFTGRKSVYASEPISVGALLDVQVCEINEEYFGIKFLFSGHQSTRRSNICDTKKDKRALPPS